MKIASTQKKDRHPKKEFMPTMEQYLSGIIALLNEIVHQSDPSNMRSPKQEILEVDMVEVMDTSLVRVKRTAGR